MEWKITYYSELLQKEIMALPIGIQARYIHLTKRMLNQKKGLAGFFYCTLINKRIVMLHSFVKKTHKLKQNMIY